MDIPVEVTDSYDIQGTTQKLLNMLQNQQGVQVLVCRRECALLRMAREKKTPYKVYVDSDKCIGADCGCDKYCSRVFKCPGLVWDKNTKKSKIDEAICVGCGVCVDICPQSAIIREAN